MTVPLTKAYTGKQFIVVHSDDSAWARAYWHLWASVAMLSQHFTLPDPADASTMSHDSSDATQTHRNTRFDEPRSFLPHGTPGRSQNVRTSSQEDCLEQIGLTSYNIDHDSQIVWTTGSTGTAKTQAINVDSSIHPKLRGKYGFHHLAADDPSAPAEDAEHSPIIDATVHQLNKKNKKSQKKQKGHSRKTPCDDVGGARQQRPH